MRGKKLPLLNRENSRLYGSINDSPIIEEEMIQTNPNKTAKSDWREILRQSYHRLLRRVNQDPLFIQTATFYLYRLRTFEAQETKTCTSLINHSNKAYWLTNGMNGQSLVTTKLWPATFAGLLLHDVAHFYMHPEMRFGNTLTKILIGASPNQQGLSSHLGTDIVTDYSYWLWPSLLIVAPLTLSIGRACLYYPQHYMLSGKNPNQLLTFANKHSLWNDIGQRLLPWDKVTAEINYATLAILYDKDLSTEQRKGLLKRIIDLALKKKQLTQLTAINALSRITDNLRHISSDTSKHKQDEQGAQYVKAKTLSALKKLAEFHVDKDDCLVPKIFVHTLYTQYKLWSIGHPQSRLLPFVFTPLLIIKSSVILYSDIRILKLVIEKLTNAFEFLLARQQCENEHKVWGYISDLADYACTICSDWPYVNAKAAFTPEGCLNGLLSEQRSPDKLLAGIKRLSLYPVFEELDLSQQNWANWTETEWNDLMTQIEAIESISLKLLNISKSFTIFPAPAVNKIQRLAGLLQHIPVKQLDLHAQDIGAHGIKALLPGISNGSLTDLNIAANNLGDEGIIYLTDALESRTIQALDLNSNKITDAGLSLIANRLHNSTLNCLNLSNNRFKEKGLNTFFMAVSKKQFKALDLSQNNLANIDFEMVGETITQSGLIELRLSATNMADDQLAVLSNYLKPSCLRILDVSNNNFLGQGTKIFIKNLRNSTIIDLNLSNTKITNDKLDWLARHIGETAIEHLNLANNRFANSFPHQLVKPPLKRLNLAHNRLNRFLSSIKLTELDISHNEITPNAASSIMKDLVYEKSPLKVLKIGFNNLDNSIAEDLQNLLQKTSLTMIELNNNAFNGSEIPEKIAEVLSKSPLQALILRNNFFGDNVEAIARQLIADVPYKNNLGRVFISRNERRALQSVQAQTRLHYLDIANTGMKDDAARMYCRIWPVVNNTGNNMVLTNNPVSTINLATCRMTTNEPYAIEWKRIKTESRTYHTTNRFFNRSINGTSASLSPIQNERAGLNMNAILGILLPVTSVLVLFYLLYRLIAAASRCLSGIRNQTSFRQFGLFRTQPLPDSSDEGNNAHLTFPNK